MRTVSDTGSLHVDLQIAVDEVAVPEDADWRSWVSAALSAAGRNQSGVVTVRLVTEDESAMLNLSYRDKPGPTNVLAFSGPGDDLPGGAPTMATGEMADERLSEKEIGDLVICLPIACREAGEQGKRPVEHLAHLVVHGTLHLMGYDHGNEVEANRMEALEIRILDELGIANPYVVTEQASESSI